MVNIARFTISNILDDPARREHSLNRGAICKFYLQKSSRCFSGSSCSTIANRRVSFSSPKIPPGSFDKNFCKLWRIKSNRGTIVNKGADLNNRCRGIYAKIGNIDQPSMLHHVGQFSHLRLIPRRSPYVLLDRTLLIHFQQQNLQSTLCKTHLSNPTVNIIRKRPHRRSDDAHKHSIMPWIIPITRAAQSRVLSTSKNFPNILSPITLQEYRAKTPLGLALRTSPWKYFIIRATSIYRSHWRFS